MGRPAIDTLGIDFGTSNSAAARTGPDGLARLIALEGDARNLPTAVFFNAETRGTLFGREAVAAYLAGVEGRLMRSLKSLLGSSLLHEKTAVAGGLISFQDVIGRFLGEIGDRVERRIGTLPARVAIGRPVHFVDEAPERDRQAQEALTHAARAAGFKEVAFVLEPIAAAFDHERRMDSEQVVLIVDIGGGTSDFTVVRLGPKRIGRHDRSDDILATSGVHIGGTDYDRKLSLEEVMPLLGFRHLGPQGREVPSAVFFDLSTWHLINWAYSPKALRHADELRTSYSDLRLHRRLTHVLHERLGHRIASEVEQAKIRGSLDGTAALVDLGGIEPGLQAALSPDSMERQLAPLLGQVVQCAQDCVALAGLAAGGVDAIYLTGGSSALRPFQQALHRGFPGTSVIEGDLFGGVACGLAYA
jgi:hypothetical chaperone protein